ncbi:hypothetical protein GGS23DRAFT_556932 [Durotheca rogersii]|uniref:uncharacterized protein n=1 Tax=Durotheca rogersii TaxID=419775 RepID=UPI00221F351F|nr:uncharacterized protein GGS23DRAFT_556932 [Durotheca rogersii]KAI5864965.1 hypothetical protein GGS23DRAFT_556932 [Durotheca rogersii]
MAFGFGNPGGAIGGSGGATQGPDLQVIQTESLGFLSLSGDAKLQLTSRWTPPPADNASLISIASRKGLVAAAGPDAVILTSTEAVRKAFDGPKYGDSETRVFEPPLKLALPIRICQLAFTSDEAYLILSAEQGGGLAVYEVEALQQGSSQAAFEIPTNGESLRLLAPNPEPKRGELCAVVTNGGKLLMVNMQERSFVSGPNGQILKDQVSCVAWSNKGKQLVAGLGDGTILQMTPEGSIEAEIPRPPGLDPNYFVSSLIWLKVDIFLGFHVSASEQPPQTRCHLITRQGQQFQFQKLSDPVDPFGSEKTPHHTIMRLRDFPPNLLDVLICSSTATPDIGLLTRSKTPLAPNGPSNLFATTELADDSRRATLPMGDGMESPAAIGTALDLSSRDNVYKPIPTDEIDQSAGPLPGYWVLNVDGVLSVWWIVYSESIRQRTVYPGLVASEGNPPGSIEPAVPKQAQQPFSAATPSPFGAPMTAPGAAFGSPSTLGSSGSPWGAQPSSGHARGPAFGSSGFGTGTASSTPKFGTASFGVSSFGTASTPAFGQSTGLGAKPSPWATGSTSSSTPAFGQSGFAKRADNTNASASSFGGASYGAVNSTGGFASFANKGGFASLGSSNAGGASIFTSTKAEAPEVSMDAETTSIFRPSSSKPSIGSGAIFGSQPFKLTSSFQPDPNVRDQDANKNDRSNEEPMFYEGFAATLNGPIEPTPLSPPSAGTQNTFGQSSAESTTPISTPAPSKFLTQTSPPPQTKGIFDIPSKTSSKVADTSSPSTSQTPTGDISRSQPEMETPKPMKHLPEVPLPPESTSKASYALGESSSSSAVTADALDVNEAPPGDESVTLPLDSTNSPRKAERGTPLKALPVVVDDAPLPPDPIKNKKAYDTPLPPLPGMIASAKEVDAAPSPPDPAKQTKAYEGRLSVLTIAKPAFAAAGPGFKFPTNPLPVSSDSDDDDLSEEEEGTEAVSEGSGVDVAKDLSPSSIGANRTPGFTPQSSFNGLAGSYSTVPHPDQEKRYFGELGRNMPILPRPNLASPRSPSPVRSTVPARILVKDQARSVSAPGMASQILSTSRRHQSRLGMSIVGRDTHDEEAAVEQHRMAKARREAEESRLLLDEEDDTIQELLRTEVKPTLELDEFIAHSGVAPPAGDSVPAQVEAVYRDINSMIDTLGLNARSLAGFIKGHEEVCTKGLTRQDLASADNWTLAGLENLADIIDQDLSLALDEARIVDVADRLAQCVDIQRDLGRDRNKQADLKKIVSSRLDPDLSVAYRALPLSSEQAVQQSDLRREYAKFTKLLAEAEESLTMLKAKIVSVNSASGKGGPAPTIEAVVRTITKLTSMVEKRSGDIDVLENHMRKLRVSSYGLGSREGSPLAASHARRLTVSSLLSPERSARENTPQRSSVLRHSMSGSVASIGVGVLHTPPRKKLTGFGDAEKRAVMEKRDRRVAVLGKLRGSLQKRGVGVWAVDDIE